MVNELLLMQFTNVILVLNCITGSDKNKHHTACQQNKHSRATFSMQFER